MDFPVKFKHRSNKPTNPEKGSFYWVDNGSETEIWFSSTSSVEGLILLNDKLDESDLEGLISRITELEGKVETIEIDLSQYVKIEDIDELTELTDSDYDNIAEKVNEKIPPLTWEEI